MIIFRDNGDITVEGFKHLTDYFFEEMRYYRRRRDNYQQRILESESSRRKDIENMIIEYCDYTKKTMSEINLKDFLGYVLDPVTELKIKYGEKEIYIDKTDFNISNLLDGL